MAENVKDINKISEIKPLKLNNIPKDVKDFNAKQAAVAEANGELGNFIKKMEKERGYNRSAFKLGAALAKKTVQKRQDFLMTLDAIRDKLGWDHEQGDMLANAETGNVVPLRGGEEAEEAPQPPALAAAEVQPN